MNDITDQHKLQDRLSVLEDIIEMNRVDSQYGETVKQIIKDRSAISVTQSQNQTMYVGTVTK